MAGNQMPVLTLDVNEEHLRRLEAIFEKYRNGLMIGPAGTPLKIPSNTGPGGGSWQTTTGGEANQAPRKPSSPAPTDGRLRDENGRFVGRGKTPDSLVSNYKGRGETMFDKYLNSLGKNAQATLKTYKQINSTLYQTNSRLKSLFKTTVSWGAKISAMGAVGPFGYGYMASKVAAQYSVAQGLGMTTAQMQAARATYSPYFSGTEELVQHLVNAQKNPNDPNYAGLVGLGIDPRDGAAKNLPKLMSALASLVKQYKGSGLTQGILNGQGLGFVDVATTNQVEANLDKIPQLNEKFAANTRLLGAYLTPAMQSDYQDTVSNLMVNGHRIFSAWQASMAGYNPLIRDTTNGFTTAIETFLTGKNFKEILTDVKDGLENFGTYINGPNVNKDLNNFAANVAKVVKALGGFVGFAAEHPWLFGATMLAGPSALGTAGVAAGAAGSKIIPAVFPRSIIPGRIGLARGLSWLQALVPYNDTPTTSEEMKGLEGRFNFDYFNEVQEWQKNNPGKVWPGGLQKYSNNVNRSAYLYRGIRNNNPGNLNFAGQKGATLESGPNARFASFPTMLEGIAALDRQVMLYLKRGKNTIDQIIDIYAPSSDGNNTSSYKSYLSQYTGLGVKEKIDGSNFELMRKLIQGIINHENGAAARAVTGDDVMRALAMNRGNVYSPNNTSQVIRLEVQQKPGSDILAQLAGMQQIPG
ncbi:lytic transglycosylase domain-containing protein [Escherichia coli]|uniref:lytic transglycosylase domain-containing protein n=1 Tax=Escherichia coli TaxID=562 RepID=UPI0038B2B313